MSCRVWKLRLLIWVNQSSYHWTGEFNIYTRSAGSGSLSITMEGPGKAILNLSEMKDESNNYSATYLVDKPGEYRLAIKYADKHIPESPFR